MSMLWFLAFVKVIAREKRSYQWFLLLSIMRVKYLLPAQKACINRNVLQDVYVLMDLQNKVNA